VTDAELSRILSPVHFIEVRRTPGGPAPAIVADALDASRTAASADGAAWTARGAREIAAESRRRQAVDAI
jgi:hypothetical protein